MEFHSFDQYLLTCTKTQRKIFRFFLDRYSDKPIAFANPYIAKQVDCCLITIKTATGKFHRDGMIVKYQINGKFDVNTFAFTDLFKKLMEK